MKIMKTFAQQHNGYKSIVARIDCTIVWFFTNAMIDRVDHECWVSDSHDSNDKCGKERCYEMLIPQKDWCCNRNDETE